MSGNRHEASTSVENSTRRKHQICVDGWGDCERQVLQHVTSRLPIILDSNLSTQPFPTCREKALKSGSYWLTLAQHSAQSSHNTSQKTSPEPHMWQHSTRTQRCLDFLRRLTKASLPPPVLSTSTEAPASLSMTIKTMNSERSRRDYGQISLLHTTNPLNTVHPHNPEHHKCPLPLHPQPLHPFTIQPEVPKYRDLLS